MHPRIREIRDALAAGEPVQTAELKMVHARFEGRPVTFCVNTERDPVQNNHRIGTFYEKPELWAMRKVFPRGGTFVDIGANVGNHTLWAALFLNAGRVIPVEPNATAFEMLIANVIVNGIADRVDLSRLGVGVSDTDGGGYRMERRRTNLGSARLLRGRGSVEVRRGDALLADVTPDYIKIDVEGMEIKVLSGLEGLLERARPLILVEVDNPNEPAFLAWTSKVGYQPVQVHQRYPQNKNHLIADAAQAEALKARLDQTQPA